jgi:phosphate transport system substrate-binding protein
VDSIGVRSLAPGEVVGAAYRVVRPVAEGGMGAIYEVEQMATGALRALKVMHGQFAADEKLRARFVLEARLAASIPSDHVAQVMDAGQDPTSGALYIVMELLDGTTLSQELRRAGAFAWPVAIAILEQVAHALSAAHAMGIVHRDLKPANVFLARSRHAGLPFTVKLLDFGIAKAIQTASDATMAALGTPAWMAPEQTSADAPIGPQADVWSYGLLAFQLLAGRHYFSSANARSAPTAAVLREVVLDPLLPASERAANLGVADRLPSGFDAWFARCVDRSPDKRFADVRVAYESLASLTTPVGVDATFPSPPPPSADALPLSRRRLDTPVTAIEGFPSGGPWDGAPVTAPGPVSSEPSQPPSPAGRPSTLFVALLVAAAGLLALVLWHVRSSEPATAAAMAAPIASVAPPAPLLFRMHGSNTIGGDLAPALAEAFLQRRTAAKGIVRTRTAPDEVRVEAVDGSRPVEAVEVFAHGSTTAFEDLASGACDIGMASRRIRPDEAVKLAPLGDLASAASEHVIALDGIAVIVNPANAVSALTKAQIGDVFSGKVVRWSEVGGADAPIVVHARDDRSGTFDTFSHLVLGGKALAPGARRHESSEELSDAVAADTHAIGFIGLPYVRSTKAVMVQEAGSAPLLPSPMTVATEDYPLARRLYLYLPPGAPIAARDFVDFALSAEGQKVVASTGFVDLDPTCDTNAASSAEAQASRQGCAACTREYKELVRGACRLSMDFRFDRANSQLDTRALRDLQRVVGMMGRPDYAGRAVLLLGFSDAAGPRAEGVAGSQQRVAVVADQLRARGLHVGLQHAFGPEMPVADDSTAEGREKNQRVEVWLR